MRPNGLAPHAYANNNPLLNTDPDGRIVPLLIIGGSLLIGGEWEFFRQAEENKAVSLKDAHVQANYGRVAAVSGVSAAAAAAAVATGGAALSMTGALGIGGVATGAGGATALTVGAAVTDASFLMTTTVSTGSTLVASVVGGASAAYVGTTGNALIDGASPGEAHERGLVAAPVGAIGGAVTAGLGSALAPSLVRQGFSTAAAYGASGAVGSLAGDAAYQGLSVALQLQPKFSATQMVFSAAAGGALGYNSGRPVQRAQQEGILWRFTFREFMRDVLAIRERAMSPLPGQKSVVEGAMNLDNEHMCVQRSHSPATDALSLPAPGAEDFAPGVCGMSHAAAGVGGTSTLVTRGGFRYNRTSDKISFVSACGNCIQIPGLNPGIEATKSLPPGVPLDLPSNTAIPFSPPESWWP
jgi:hypothetical protein